MVYVVFQLLSSVQLFATPLTAAHQASQSFSISQSLLKLMSIEYVMSSNHLILCRPLLLLPSLFPSIRAFSNELALWIRWPKYWSLSFSISPSNEYSGLISFRIEWFDVLVVQGALKSLLQHHSSKASALWCPAFLMVQLFHLVHDHWKNHSFDQTDICWQSNVSAFEYTVQVGHSFSSKEQASFNFMAAVTICSDFGAQENKATVSIVSASVCHEVMGPDAMVFVF